jgi:hypothetical protein
VALHIVGQSASFKKKMAQDLIWLLLLTNNKLNMEYLNLTDKLLAIRIRIPMYGEAHMDL